MGFSFFRYLLGYNYKKMNVTLFQKFDDIEPYFWTKEQIEQISFSSDNLQDRYFTINNIHYKWKCIRENAFLNLDFQFEEGINLVVIGNSYPKHDFKRFLDILKSTIDTNKKVYILFSKLDENYWGFIDNRDDDKFLKIINDIPNVKVIWDVPFYKLDNFIFSPKVQIQSFFLNSTHGGFDPYYWGRDVFMKYPKDYRIGLHINKIQDNLRLSIVKGLKGYNNKNLFYTVNSNCTYNKKTVYGDLSQFGNYVSPTYDSRLHGEHDIGINNNWYTIGLLEMGIKSQMEIVYETFTYNDNIINDLWQVKWNEKTIKHLYLGKPFIHCDPIAHKLVYQNGMKPYRSLYSDKLWDIYENWDINIKKDYSYIDTLIENIKWLSDMTDTEWSERIGEAMKIAEWNKNKVDELIFNTSLIDIVKSDIY